MELAASIILFLLAAAATAVTLFQCAGKIGVFGYAFLSIDARKIAASFALAVMLWYFWWAWT